MTKAHKSQGLYDLYTTPIPFKRESELLTESVSYLSTQGPLSKEVSELYSRDKLACMEYVIPYSKASTNDVIGARQIQAFLQKNNSICVDVDPLKAGEAAFIAAEKSCQRVNRFGVDARSRDVSIVLHYASHLIGCVLGRDGPPPISDLDLRFGPGASTSVKGSVACVHNKLHGPLVCSRELVPVAAELLAAVPPYAAYHCEGSDESDDCLKATIEIHTGKLAFVPKNAKTHRPICIEPALNGLCQLGVGSFLKRRLNAFGVNLLDQGPNRELARQGSMDGSLATVDLKSASDTISKMVVLNLLPLPWFDYLSAFRTGTVRYGKFEFELEKFSSMGNGFTFELESLIFWALAKSTCRHLSAEGPVSVYGDDVIIPVSAVSLFYEVLEACGFIPNKEKSFAEGPFRESCGADWHHGVDVRPFYLREKVTQRHLFLGHNWFLRHGEYQLAKIWKSYVDPKVAIYGPDGYGDGHLIGDWDPVLPRRFKRRGYSGGFFESYQAKPRRLKGRSMDMLDALYLTYRRAGGEGVLDPFSVRVIDGKEQYNRTSIYTHKSGIFLT